MGWKGTLRAIEASGRRAEREALRRQRELERQRKQSEKMQELEQAQYEVELYENKIELLTSIHQDCGNELNWEKIKITPSLIKPQYSNKKELIAKKILDSYKPNIIDKTFKRIESKRAKLIKNVEIGKNEDELNYQKALKDYEKKYSEWKENNDLATKILNGDKEAYEEAIKQLNPFSEIKEIGSSLNINVIDRFLIDVVLKVNSEQVIPTEVKSLLRSGKLSIKQMPKGQFYGLYQDYVCSCVLRVARELFMLLPIKAVSLTALGNLLNTQTGYIEEQPILSAFVPKNTLDKLNFSMIDPSDSMSNFVHNMNFKRTNGFSAVEKVKALEMKVEI
jgi:hypothetical protein